MAAIKALNFQYPPVCLLICPTFAAPTYNGTEYDGFYLKI